MIKMTAGKLLLLGLSEQNLMRLREGKPISFKLSELGVDSEVEICIMWGPTELDILRELKAPAEVIAEGERLQRKHQRGQS
jgi:hypothetical protein